MATLRDIYAVSSAPCIIYRRRVICRFYACHAAAACAPAGHVGSPPPRARRQAEYFTRAILLFHDDGYLIMTGLAARRLSNTITLTHAEPLRGSGERLEMIFRRASGQRLHMRHIAPALPGWLPPILSIRRCAKHRHARMLLWPAA